VEDVFYQDFEWDEANNLTNIHDQRPSAEWPTGHRPQSIAIAHDALYHVVGAEFSYSPGPFDSSNDWRSEAASANALDPMHPQPAPRIGSLPSNRPMDLDYAWDWQGNQTSWNDDAYAFHERSLGTIVNGRELGTRPSALYLATNLPMTGGISVSWGGAGWLEVDYGRGGNVLAYTVHGACQDASEPASCTNGESITDLAQRRTHLRTACICATEQHYEYRWDELNRLIEARRFDRSGGTGNWSLAARMRYRYDGANQRTVTENFVTPNTSHRVTLYVHPGDMERRGLVRGISTYDAVTTGTDATETQYVIAGARIVWDAITSTGTGADRNRRITIAVTDLLQTASAVVDLPSGELLEASTYYPNGTRENLWASDRPIPLETAGFTGKEADEDVGATYFGERWLLPHLGRWASPDPLHIHANGGGEALNSFHYVGGNLLASRDPLGLDITTSEITYFDPLAMDSRQHRVSEQTNADANWRFLELSVGAANMDLFRREGSSIVASEQGTLALVDRALELQSPRRVDEATMHLLELAADPGEHRSYIVDLRSDAPRWLAIAFQSRHDLGAAVIRAITSDGEGFELGIGLARRPGEGNYGWANGQTTHRSDRNTSFTLHGARLTPRHDPFTDDRTAGTFTHELGGHQWLDMEGLAFDHGDPIADATINEVQAQAVATARQELQRAP
jgi:RHS repeat-associated protein